MSYDLQNQAFNVTPPRRSDGFALSVDSTARVYDVGSLAWGGRTFDEAAADKALFLTLEAETADVYYRFRGDSGAADLNQATVIAAGGTVALQVTFGSHLVSNTSRDVRIDRLFDRYLEVKTSAGTATLRVSISSNPPR